MGNSSKKTHTSSTPGEIPNSGKTNKTANKTMKKTLEPTWDETFRFPGTLKALANEQLFLKVYDWDQLSSPDFMGTVATSAVKGSGCILACRTGPAACSYSV